MARKMPELVDTRLICDSGTTVLSKATTIFMESAEMVSLLLAEGATLDLVNDKTKMLNKMNAAQGQHLLLWRCCSKRGPLAVDMIGSYAIAVARVRSWLPVHVGVLIGYIIRSD